VKEGRRKNAECGMNPPQPVGRRLQSQNWQSIRTLNPVELGAFAPRSVAQLGRSARYGAGGDSAARCPYYNQSPQGAGKRAEGEKDES
jgi:hypothetical protein